MGRSLLIIVVLMSTIYAGISLSMQRKMLSLPHITARNMINKEAESVSDYALRTAVRNSVALGLQAQTGSFTKITTIYDNFKVGKCIIDSISYTFVESANHYRAITYVRGSLHGIDVQYPAEIAFNFPLSMLTGTPTCFYLEMDQPQFNPSFNMVYDTSDNANDAFFHGDVDTRPMGSGVNGWKCASFGIGGGWIQHPGHSSMEVESNFSLVVFAKIRAGHPAATLMWIPSDPYDTAIAVDDKPGQNLRYKPSSAIWFSGGNMNYTVTTTDYQVLQLSIPFVPDGQWPHNKDKWHFFGLTYNRGVLKAYVNGILRGSTTAGYLVNAIRNTYGFTLGRKDIRILGSGGSSEYMYMYGLMDQVGLYDRTLSDAEMYNFYQAVINPADILYIKD